LKAYVRDGIAQSSDNNGGAAVLLLQIASIMTSQGNRTVGTDKVLAYIKYNKQAFPNLAIAPLEPSMIKQLISPFRSVKWAQNTAPHPGGKVHPADC